MTEKPSIQTGTVDEQGEFHVRATVVDGDKVVADVDNQSVNTEETHTDSLAYSRGSAPTSPRSPATPGGYAAKPHPYVDNPVFNSSTHADWDGGADPFLAYESPYYYVFFEGFAASGGRDITLTRSPDLINWEFQGAVLEESFDQGYPFMQKLDGTWYMIPTNTTENDKVYIYEADPFPRGWKRIETALNAANFSNVSQFSDPTPFYWPRSLGGDDRWYLIAMDSNGDNNLFFSKTLLDGSWSAHPSNPIRSSDKMRGTPIVGEGYVDVWAQPDVTAVRIHDLSTESYADSEMGQVIGGHSNDAWNSQSMHHFDPLLSARGADGVAVDGHDGSDWSIGIYTFADKAPSKAKLYTAAAAQTVDNQTFTDIEFDTVAHTVPDIREDTSNNQITAEQSGYYKVSGNITFKSLTSLPNRILVRVYTSPSSPEGEIVTGHVVQPTNTVEDVSAPLPETEAYLESGNSVRVEVYHDAGSGETINVQDGLGNTYLSVSRSE